MVRRLLASLLFTAACSTAQADQPGAFGPPPPPGTAIAIGIADAKIRAPYDVQVLRENGQSLPTFGQRDRYYVQGNAGERYTIKVTNPTARRVEAVVSVDGLDVIDGEDGDLRKRGYVVPPYGEVRIEGFRTSVSDVATFRFNSVNDSYANKKGKARNVGVIAVAIFEEQHEIEQQIIVEPTAPAVDYDGRAKKDYDYTDDLAERGPAPRQRPSADKSVVSKSPSPKPDSVAVRGGESQKRRAPADAPTASRPAPQGGAGAPSRPYKNYDADEGDYEEMPPPPTGPRNNRPGLGTEFGENRYSAASYTKFVRAAQRPIAVAELRYNDQAGLVALGISAGPLPDAGELMTRETADPFPGDHRYSVPPTR
jgi:hypothetical protein